MKHPVVSYAEWEVARKALLAAEKDLTRRREKLTKMRRDLPWHRVDKRYVFEGASGNRGLDELFGRHSQLIVYHFMFAPEWDEGCKICSLCADHYDPLIVHLAARDTAMVTVSSAPIAKLQAYRERMGWAFEWLSCAGSDFNRDYGVSFSADEVQSGRAIYNYEPSRFPTTEAPGISSFVKNDRGEIFHTYSAYARGLESFLGVYSFLDIVAKGRDEDDLTHPMGWVRRHDSY